MPVYNAAAVSDAVIAFRKPITLQQGRAGMRDNLIAAFEGAAGAPRLYGNAAVPNSHRDELPLLTVTAADTAIISSGIEHSGAFAAFNPTSTSFESAGIITNVLLSGTVRFKATQVSGNSSQCAIRILKNGVEVGNWTITSDGSGNSQTATRTIDIAIAPTDTVEWQARRSSGTGLARIIDIITSASDAYTRIGIPIRVSDL